MDDEADKFTDWCSKLRDCMTALSYDAKFRSTGGPIVDSMIPYRMGWSPQRTARAMLGFDRDDTIMLRDLAVKGE